MNTPSPKQKRSPERSPPRDTLTCRSPEQTSLNRHVTVAEPVTKTAPSISQNTKQHQYRAVAKDFPAIMARVEPNILRLFGQDHSRDNKKHDEAKDDNVKPIHVLCSLFRTEYSEPKCSFEKVNENMGSPPRCFSSIQSMSVVTPLESTDCQLNQMQTLLVSNDIMISASPESIILQEQSSQDKLSQEILQEGLAMQVSPTDKLSSKQQNVATPNQIKRSISPSLIKELVRVRYHIMGPFTLPKFSFIQRGMSPTEYNEESRYPINLLQQKYCVSHFINYNTMSCYSIRSSYTNLPSSTIVALDSIKRLAIIYNLKRKYWQYFNISALLLDVLTGGIFNEEQLLHPKDSWYKSAFTSLSVDQQKQICTKLRLKIGWIVNYINNTGVIPQFCHENISFDCLADIMGKRSEKGIDADKYIDKIINSITAQSFNRTLSNRDDFMQLKRTHHTNDTMVDIVLTHISLMFDTFYGTKTFCASPFILLNIYNSIASAFYHYINNRTQDLLSYPESPTVCHRLWLIDLIVFPVCYNHHWYAYLYIGKNSKLNNTLMKLCDYGSTGTGRQTPIWIDKILQCNSMEKYPIDEVRNSMIIQYMNMLDQQLSTDCSTGNPPSQSFTKKSIVPLQICQQRDQHSCAYHIFVLVFSLLSMIFEEYKLPNSVTPEQLAIGDWTNLYHPMSTTAMKYWVLQYIINNSTYEEVQDNTINLPRTSKQESMGPELERSEDSSSSVRIITDQ